MKKIVIITLLICFLPVEIFSEPAPVAALTIVLPICVLFLGVRLSDWVLFSGLVLLVGLTQALLNGLILESLLPILSYLSFAGPIFGIFLGLNEQKRQSENPIIISYICLPVGLLAGALLLNLFIYGFGVRSSVESFNDQYGYYSAASAAGTIYGTKMFASFGVNSFAGILLSFFCLGMLGYPQATKRCRVILAMSFGTILIYGFLLQSRMFAMGFAVFIFVLILRSRLGSVSKVFMVVSLFLVLTFVAILDERLMLTVNALLSEGVSSEDWASLTSNRSTLLADIPRLELLVFGSGFGKFLSYEHASSSYHLYLLTLFSKGGLLFALPITYILVKALRFPTAGGDPSRTSQNVVINATLWSFAAQSFVWDIYAVQVFGHIGWFFVGLALARSSNNITP